MPTLVPKPGSSTVTQEHLPGRNSGALHALGLSWVTVPQPPQNPNYRSCENGRARGAVASILQTRYRGDGGNCQVLYRHSSGMISIKSFRRPFTTRDCNSCNDTQGRLPRYNILPVRFSPAPNLASFPRWGNQMRLIRHQRNYISGRSVSICWAHEA